MYVCDCCNHKLSLKIVFICLRCVCLCAFACACRYTFTFNSTRGNPNWKFTFHAVLNESTRTHTHILRTRCRFLSFRKFPYKWLFDLWLCTTCHNRVPVAPSSHFIPWKCRIGKSCIFSHFVIAIAVLLFVFACASIHIFETINPFLMRLFFAFTLILPLSHTFFIKNQEHSHKNECLLLFEQKNRGNKKQRRINKRFHLMCATGIRCVPRRARLHSPGTRVCGKLCEMRCCAS